MVLRIFIFCLIVALVQGSINIPSGYDLKYVHVIMRVGDHTPSEELLKLVKSAKFTKKDFSKLETLLPTGAKKMYDNGYSLFQNYGNALKLDKKTIKNFVDISSFNFKFAKESAAVAFEGLKGDESILKKIGKGELHTKGIPYVKDMIEDITRAYYPEKCPYYHKALENSLKAWQVFEKRPALKKLKDETPNFPTDINHIYLLYELNKMYMSANKGVPAAWFKPQVQKTLEAFCAKYFRKAHSTKTLKRLVAGRYLSHIIDELEKVKSGKNNKKMLIFATPYLAPKVVSMGGNKGYKDERQYQYPNFGAMFIVELYQKKADKTYHIRLRYEQEGKSELKDNQVMILKECAEFCELQKVKNILKPVLMSKADADKECKA